MKKVLSVVLAGVFAMAGAQAFAKGGGSGDGALRGSAESFRDEVMAKYRAAHPDPAPETAKVGTVSK